MPGRVIILCSSYYKNKERLDISIYLLLSIRGEGSSSVAHLKVSSFFPVKVFFKINSLGVVPDPM